MLKGVAQSLWIRQHWGFAVTFYSSIESALEDELMCPLHILLQTSVFQHGCHNSATDTRTESSQ